MSDSDLQAVEKLSEAYNSICNELSRVIVGQQRVIEEILVAMFARGHCLLVGVPGLAKTLMVRSIADALDLQFSRVQFTPDLMPSDITGTEVIQEDKSTGDRVFRFLKGPIFANMILADEINRTPPKTQAALLEAMQEKQVTVGGDRHSLPEPFFVLATQNPIEQEGTYPLPEAQLDRFMFMTLVDYPDEAEELEIVKRTTADINIQLTRMLSAEEITNLASIVRKVPIADAVATYAMNLARLSRPKDSAAPDFVRDYVMWGAGPRASQYLVLGGKARAVLQGRKLVQREDIDAVSGPVLRHRIKTNFTADAEGVTSDDIIAKLRTAAADRTDGKPSGIATNVLNTSGAGETAGS